MKKEEVERLIEANSTIKDCYKQSYLSYKISQCGSFKDLVEVLKGPNMPIVSYSRTKPIVYTASLILLGIKCVYHNQAFINTITRSEGLRAKVAELVMAKNYGEELPAELQQNLDENL